MQKITSGLALFLLAAVCSFGQIVNPSGGGGGGDVFKAGSNVFTGSNNFTSATLVLPNGTADPTGACTNAAAVFTNTTTGSQFSCIGSAWVRTNASLSSLSGDVSSTSGGASTVQGIRGVAVSATAPVTNQFLGYNGTSWLPTSLPSLAGDVTGPIGANVVGKIQGTQVSSASPLTGQLFTFNGTQWAPANAPVDSSGNSYVPGTSDNNTEDSPYGFLGAGSNFLTYSTAIGGTGWSLNGGATATQAATVAPDGSTTASLLTSGTTTANSASATFTTSIPGPYTLSVWAKSSGSSTITIDFKSGASVLQSSTFTLSSTGNGWQRIYVASTSLSASTAYTVDVYPGGNGSVSASNTNYVWGAQVNPGNSPTGFAKTYAASIPTTINGLAVGTGSLTILGTSSGSSVIQAPAVAGNQTFVLPNTAPTASQIMSAASISGSTTTLGWLTPSHQASWQVADPANDLTTTSGAAPNVAANLTGSNWTISSVYCISDSANAATFQLTTTGGNIGPSGGFTCSSTPSTITTGFTTTLVIAGQTISQTLTAPAVGMKHMTVVVSYK